jgi:hypothetical protein
MTASITIGDLSSKNNKHLLIKQLKNIENEIQINRAEKLELLRRHARGTGHR